MTSVTTERNGDMMGCLQNECSIERVDADILYRKPEIETAGAAVFAFASSGAVPNNSPTAKGDPMRTILAALLVVSFSLFSIGAAPQLGTLKTPAWAFPVTDSTLPATPPEPAPAVAGSSRTYTRAQIDDAMNPPNWFPNENAPKPQIVLHGHGDALACGACHLMTGSGHPESANVAGLPLTYILRQLGDFKSGARKDTSRMNDIAQALTDEEIHQAAEWMSGLKPLVWTKVVEAAMVPKTYVGAGRMRFATPDGMTEAIGNRIITLPQDPAQARNRNPRSGFIAYVPVGSIAAGEALVKNGGNGKTIACTTCHGEDLHGLADVPRLAGVHPIYIVRQLHLFQNGERAGLGSQLMKKPVAQLNDEDILSIAAYLGSLAP
jgi:cytochrome c553